jgi:hypothetical protein
MTQDFTNNPGGSGAGTGDGLRAELKDDAGRLTQTVKEQAGAKIDVGKEQATKTARSASSALNVAANELRNDQNAPDWLATALSSLAQQIEQYAGRIDASSPQAMTEEAKRFARQNPAAFLAASAAAGFAAARLLRAGAEYQSEHEASSAGAVGGSSNGYSQQSSAQSGYGQQGYTSQGASGQGASGQGASGQGASGQGATGQGYTGQSTWPAQGGSSSDFSGGTL